MLSPEPCQRYMSHVYQPAGAYPQDMMLSKHTKLKQSFGLSCNWRRSHGLERLQLFAMMHRRRQMWYEQTYQVVSFQGKACVQIHV